jgi:7-cyano-7-deazaguanine synthase in queuosine biosynthesis
MMTKTNYIERRTASLRALELEIAKLMDYADRVAAELSVKYYEAIQGMQVIHDNAARMLRELHAVSEKAWVWEDATSGVEDAWSDLRNAVMAAIATTYGDADRRSAGKRVTVDPHQAYRQRRIAPRGSCY